MAGIQCAPDMALVPVSRHSTHSLEPPVDHSFKSQRFRNGCVPDFRRRYRSASPSCVQRPRARGRRFGRVQRVYDCVERAQMRTQVTVWSPTTCQIPSAPPKLPAGSHFQE